MNFRGSGDLGDLAFSLCVVKAVPGVHNYFLVDRKGITSPIKPRVHLIAPLIEAQPYISSCTFSEEEPDVDFVNFRHFHSNCHTLLQSHVKQFQLETGRVVDTDGSEPWLVADPSPKSEGRIVIARSPRYNNSDFPWTKIVHHYRKRLLFVGLEDEHAAFVHANGWVEHAKTKNLLDVAELIAGSSLFIGNQSSPMAVALGLGHPLIQETCATQPDCIYNRSNAQYVCDGACVLPDIDGSGTLSIPVPEPDVSFFSRNMVPPGYWQYPGLPPSGDFKALKLLVARLLGIDDNTADLQLMLENVKRVPDFFSGSGEAPMETFKLAYQAAFNKPVTTL